MSMPPPTALNGVHSREDTGDLDRSSVDVKGLQQQMAALAVEASQIAVSADIAAQSDGIDYQTLLEKARVRPGDQIGKPVSCWAIINGDQQSIVGTMGNISTMTGRAKSKKTFAVTIAVAAAVASSPILERVEGLLQADNNTVMVFDTEQSRYHVLRVVKRICSLCGVREPANLLVYSLRPYAPDERLKAIDWAVNNTPGLGLVVIDGIRDLAVDPITDSEQASRIMTHLLRWTDLFNIHILTVLHQNKGDTNLRGHLGTELVNKSETVISISRDPQDKEVSIVAPEFCRDREFDEFRFSVDENGLPFLVGASKAEVVLNHSPWPKAKPKPTFDTMKPDEIQAIINRAFSQDPQLKYTQLLNNLIEASEFVGVTLSKSRAERFIPRAVIQGQIEKVTPAKSRYAVYQLSSKD